MANCFRQTGAFILATVVFLMVAGSLMLYAMTNFSVVTSATTSVTHNGNMALIAAQSGLKYCVANGNLCPPTGALAIAGISAPPSESCAIKVENACSGAGPQICTIKSTACCPNSSNSLRGAKKLEIKVQNINGYYQMIPASRLVMTPDACPL